MAEKVYFELSILKESISLQIWLVGNVGKLDKIRQNSNDNSQKTSPSI